MADKTTNIYSALMAAQRDMGPLLKNATNPAFRSKYADLGSVIETITEPLHNNGLTFYQRMRIEGGAPVLESAIVHVETEQMIESLCPVVSKDPQDPQKMGAAITYARRYSLMALLGLAPEDDDGNSASKAANAPRTEDPYPADSKPVASPDDPMCEIPGCARTVYKSKEELNKKYHKGHTICYLHSTNGNWETALQQEEQEPNTYEIARETFDVDPEGGK